METKTTVTIDKKHAFILDKICKSNKTTKKDFICAAISYFEKYGINPISHESPAQEMQKLIKRVDQVIAFIRTQEKEILRPFLEAVITTDERIKITIDSLATKQDIKSITDKYQFVLSCINDNNSLISQTRSQEQAFKALAKLIDSKEKSSIFSDISKIYNQSKS